MPATDEKIIVADNDSMMRGLVRSMLDRPGRTVLLCADGLEAVEVAAHTLASLVLLDLKMPRMTGTEACRTIREMQRYADVPIVVMTVFDEDHRRREVLREGATAFLAKPFSRDQLIRAIAPLLAPSFAPGGRSADRAAIRPAIRAASQGR